MKSLDKKDYNLLDKLNDNEKKELEKFCGYLALRWMSSADDNVDHQLSILQVNDINKSFFNLSRHKELQIKLMTYAGLGHITRHSYIKPPGSKKENTLYEIVRMIYPDISDEDCEFFLRRCSEAEFSNLAKHGGYQSKSSKIKSDQPFLEDLVKEFITAYAKKNT